MTTVAHSTSNAKGTISLRSERYGILNVFVFVFSIRLALIRG